MSDIICCVDGKCEGRHCGQGVAVNPKYGDADEKTELAFKNAILQVKTKFDVSTTL